LVVFSAVVLTVVYSGPVSAEAVVGGGSSPSMTASGDLREISGMSPEWTPTPQPDISRPATARDRTLTLDQWRALQAFPEDQQQLFACIAYHESRWQTDAVGDGGRSHGAWQVQPRFWGEVPPDLNGQAEQAAEIASEYGSKPWTTAGRCQ